VRFTFTAMLKKHLKLCLGLSLLAVSPLPLISSCDAAATPLVFENLGQPVRLPTAIQFVTKDAQNRYIAWGSVLDDERRALVGVRAESGELVTVDLSSFGKSNANLLFKQNENTIVIYAGNPGRFFKYEIASDKLTPLGEVSKATYWMGAGFAVAPNGKIYVGTYPGAGVSVFDPATETVEHWTMTSDPKQAYVIIPAAADDGAVYFPVGLHHPELWSYSPATGQKKQILPASLQKGSGTCRVWTADDGQVYGQKGSTTFLCKPDGVVIGPAKGPREEVADIRIGDQFAREIDGQGRLVLEDKTTKKKKYVPTKYQSRAITLYSIGDELSGKIYGSSLKPGHTFSYDTATGQTHDLGVITGGRIQVYDQLAHGGGLFLSSYVGSYYDYYVPSQPLSETNPRRIGRAGQGQERPLQMIVGPDGEIYSSNMPTKGELGGALTRIDPQTFALKTWRNIIPSQSIMSLAPVPELNALFLTSSIAGGTSSIITEKEAFVALWDIKSEKIVFKTQPIAGAKTYSQAVRTRNGIIYGFADEKYYAFDPAQLKVVFTSALPEAKRTPLLADAPVGEAGLIYGVNRDNGAIFAINPADHSLKIIGQDKTLQNTHSISVTRSGVLYYTDGATLMRCKLP
jgi:outer membrane protein assembly factor BamB